MQNNNCAIFSRVALLLIEVHPVCFIREDACPADQKKEKDRAPWMKAGPEILALKHESRIVGQWSNPVSG